VHRCQRGIGFLGIPLRTCGPAFLHLRGRTPWESAISRNHTFSALANGKLLPSRIQLNKPNATGPDSSTCRERPGALLSCSENGTECQETATFSVTQSMCTRATVACQHAGLLQTLANVFPTNRASAFIVSLMSRGLPSINILSFGTIDITRYLSNNLFRFGYT
jgi:hypothetical protein